MIVATPRWSSSDRLVVDVRQEGETRSLWYVARGDLPTERPPTDDGVAVALVAMAMASGEDLHVEGVLSREQLAALEEYQDAWRCWMPAEFRIVCISADQIVTAADLTLPARPGASLAFSGGVDATYQLVAHRLGLVGYRTAEIRRAVVIHGFDVTLEDQDGFRHALRAAAAIIDEWDVPLSVVETNWRSFCPNWEMTFASGVAGALHCFAGDTSMGYVAADEPYDLEVVPWGSNSITNRLLGGRIFGIDSTGFGTSRTEKCRRIGRHDSIRHNVRVCWAGPDSGRNCGSCEKCVRTKLNFRAAGVGDIPALGQLTVDEVRQLRVASPQQLQLLREAARHAQELGPELARVLSRTIRRETLVLSARRARRTVSNELTRRGLRPRPILRRARLSHESGQVA